MFELRFQAQPGAQYLLVWDRRAGWEIQHIFLAQTSRGGP